MRLKADLILLLIAIIWGSAFVAQRVAGQMGSVYFFNGARYILAGLAVMPVAIHSVKRSLTNEFPAWISSSQFFWMTIAGLLLFLASALQQVGLVYTTAG